MKYILLLILYIQEICTVGTFSLSHSLYVSDRTYILFRNSKRTDSLNVHQIRFIKIRISRNSHRWFRCPDSRKERNTQSNNKKN